MASEIQAVCNLRLDDVTDNPEGVAAAFDVIAKGYATLSSRNISAKAVRDMLCNDSYHRCGLARTLLLTGNLQQGRQEVLGTVRIIPGGGQPTEVGRAPLEAMELMAPEEGWHDFRFQDFDIDRVVEGGRIAISPGGRTPLCKRQGIPRAILRELVEGRFRLANERYRKTQYWGILPEYMVKKIGSVGIGVIPAPRVFCRAENASLFRAFDRYWLNSNPRFCKVIVSEMHETAEERAGLTTQAAGC